MFLLFFSTIGPYTFTISSGTIPSELGNLKQLTQLSLNTNQLSGKYCDFKLLCLSTLQYFNFVAAVRLYHLLMKSLTF